MGAALWGMQYPGTMGYAVDYTMGYAVDYKPAKPVLKLKWF